jgi:flagellar biosynthesis GTPase FlhF
MRWSSREKEGESEKKNHRSREAKNYKSEKDNQNTKQIQESKRERDGICATSRIRTTMRMRMRMRLRRMVNRNIRDHSTMCKRRLLLRDC